MALRDWVTTTSILEGLRDFGAEDKWSHLVRCHAPTIRRFCRSAGLSETDAEDVAQETFLVLARRYREGRYERGRGRLRDWLFGIARNTMLARLRRRRENTLSLDLGDLPDERSLERSWREKWESQLVEECMARVREAVSSRTWQAFRLHALEEVPVQTISDRLDMTSNAVYVAKSTVLRRLRDELARHESA